MALTKVQSEMGQSNAPAFSAYQTGTQSISAGTQTLTVFDSKTFDTATRFNNTNATVNGIPAYSFLPNVAGYYQINCFVGNQYANNGYINLSFYKNGASIGQYGTGISLTVSYGGASGSTLIYFNGTSDYLQVYSLGNASMLLAGSYFSGALIRSA